ncbi:uncharacterized protein LOC143295022 [Babylonia areolata]|uniref:uncharacterized protein LOC143295022 n=1 Tax=Babylonia areolata TaxID=304850 RepID=UPI003FD45B4E
MTSLKPDVIHINMTTPRRLRYLLTKRAGQLGCAWLVVIPLLVFLLCQVYQLQLAIRCPSSSSSSRHDPSLQSCLQLFMSSSLTHTTTTTNVSSSLSSSSSSSSSSSGDDNEELGARSSVARLYELEQSVTERYLHVHLALAASSGRLHLGGVASAGGKQDPPLLTDVGTLRELRSFQPLLTPREKSHLLYLFQLFTEACESHGLTFFLLGDSLVGSLRHHGLTPWRDVSVTVGMGSERQVEVREVLEGVEGVWLLWPNPHSWSLRLRDVRPDPPSLSRMTYILIHFFRQNDTHVWVDTPGAAEKSEDQGQDLHRRRLFTADRHRVFPLSSRPFEGRMTPVPCDVTSVLSPAELRQCRGVVEDEEEGRLVDGGPLPCEVLSRVFPFVSRRVAVTSAGSRLEQVAVNGSLLDTVLVDRVCRRSEGPPPLRPIRAAAGSDDELPWFNST